MAKKQINLLLIAIVIIAAIFILPKLGLFSLTGVSLTRNTPSTVNPGDTFTVTYTASGVPAGNWFVAWEDSVSGGCTPTSGGLPIKGFTASEIGESISKTLTAPSSGSCTFTGFYKFADGSQVNFPSATVSICTPDTCLGLGYNCGSWGDGCGGILSCGICASGQECQTGVCFICLTTADTNCNGIVTFQELNTYAIEWVNNQVSFNDLITAAQAWVAS